MKYKLVILVIVMISGFLFTACSKGGKESSITTSTLSTDKPIPFLLPADLAAGNTAQIENKISQCLALPEKKPEVKCEPCLDYLPKDADLALSIDTQNLGESRLMSQLMKDEKFTAFYEKNRAMIPKKACVAVKFKKEEAQKSYVVPTDQKLATQATTSSAVSAEQMVDEFVVVFFPEEKLSKDVTTMMDKISADALATKGLSEQISSMIDSAGLSDMVAEKILPIPIDFFPKVIFAVKKTDSVYFVGTAVYLRSAIAGPDELSCISHPLAPIMSKFLPANLKLAGALPDAQAQGMAKAILLDGVDLGKSKYVGLALNIGGKRSFIYLKAFGGATLDEPIIEFLTALDFQSVDMTKLLKLFQPVSTTTDPKTVPGPALPDGLQESGGRLSEDSRDGDEEVNIAGLARFYPLKA